MEERTIPLLHYVYKCFRPVYVQLWGLLEGVGQFQFLADLP